MSGHLSKIRKGDLQNCGRLWARQYSTLLTPPALFRHSFICGRWVDSAVGVPGCRKFATNCGEKEFGTLKRKSE